MSLLQRRSQPKVLPLSSESIPDLLSETPGWEVQGAKLRRVFRFPDYYHTIAFVNAVAFIAHQEDHHPEMIVTYNQVEIRWDTHSVNGLSENDFICAAKVGALA